MPLSELGTRLRDQAPQKRLSRGKISLENISNMRDATNTLAGRIKNMRIRLAKNTHSNQHHKAERQKAGCISTYSQV
jgi:hypothetical protein